MKTKKIAKLLIDNIRHDFGFYNPVWKWKFLPPPLNTSYHILYPKLMEWQQKGYIKLCKKKWRNNNGNFSNTRRIINF